MSSEMKIYNLNDFIRKNESGRLDLEKSIQIVRELSLTASLHPAQNILVDLRETVIAVQGMAEIMKIVMEFVQCMPSFKNKMAAVIPSNQDRVSFEKNFEACMQIKKLHYKCFTDSEIAIEWLSGAEL